MSPVLILPPASFAASGHQVDRQRGELGRGTRGRPRQPTWGGRVYEKRRERGGDVAEAAQKVWGGRRPSSARTSPPHQHPLPDLQVAVKGRKSINKSGFCKTDLLIIKRIPRTSCIEILGGAPWLGHCTSYHTCELYVFLRYIFLTRLHCVRERRWKCLGLKSVL